MKDKENIVLKMVGINFFLLILSLMLVLVFKP